MFNQKLILESRKNAHVKPKGRKYQFPFAQYIIIYRTGFLWVVCVCTVVDINSHCHKLHVVKMERARICSLRFSVLLYNSGVNKFIENLRSLLLNNTNKTYSLLLVKVRAIVVYVIYI